MRPTTDDRTSSDNQQMGSEKVDMIIDLLKVSSVVFSGTGAYFWIRRNVWSSSKAIADFAETKWDYNESTVKELCGQRADSLVSWSYIFLGTVAQASLYFAPIPTTYGASIAWGIQHFIYLVIVCVILLAAGNLVSRNVERSLVLQTKNLLNSKK